MDKRPDELLSRIDDIEGLLRSGIAGHLDRVERLLISVARGASGEITTLAMKAVSAASLLKRNPGSADAADTLKDALSRLRSALLEAKARRTPP
jgi:hypothetical protein